MPTNTQLRLSNPFTALRSDERTRVQANISPEIAIYLFKRLLPEQGAQNCLIATFFKALYDECISRGIGIPASGDIHFARWDETIESQIAQVMLQLNFKPQTHAEQHTKLKRNPSTAKPNGKRANARANVTPSQRATANADDSRPAESVGPGA